ncbi:MAG TPA: hypothetical protein VK277_13255 [Acidimicrobiales bacterium]|nr:hypothetical protein [Acidimicrobiales bacterium]
MIRLTWRQFRFQALAVLAVLMVVAGVLLVTGIHLVHLYDTTVTSCRATGDCARATTAFLNDDHLIQVGLPPVLLVLPPLVGVFWGAPLIARELETGTFRLAWTQSVTRTRWLAVKVAVVGFASVAAVGLVTLLATWWLSPFDSINSNRFSPGTFGERGLVPLGYAAFGFAVGVTVGLLLRRALPAMVVTIVAYIGTLLTMALVIRPHLMTPLTIVKPFPVPNANGGVSVFNFGTSPNDWVLSQETVNGAGKVIGQHGGIGPNGGLGFDITPSGAVKVPGLGTCPGAHLTPPVPGSDVPTTGQDGKAFQACVNHFHIHQVLTYQPASRYWAFQCYETAIFFVLAALLVGFCFWWVRRRLA